MARGLHWPRIWSSWAPGGRDSGRLMADAVKDLLWHLREAPWAKARHSLPPLGGSKSWSGEVPNVILKDLFSAKRMKIRDLIEGKVAVIDFWLSQVGKNPFTSMDA